MQADARQGDAPPIRAGADSPESGGPQEAELLLDTRQQRPPPAAVAQKPSADGPGDAKRSALGPILLKDPLAPTATASISDPVSGLALEDQGILIATREVGGSSGLTVTIL